jgi:hypothetical protein
VANLPGDFTAAFDLDLAIGDLPRDPTARPDEQTPSHNEITVERALHIGILSRAFSFEDASLLDNDIRAVGQLCFDFAFHDQPIAGGYLTLDRDPWSDDQCPNIGFAAA